MDTLFSVFLGLLFLFSTVSSQIPTGKDEQKQKCTVWAVFCVIERKSLDAVFVFSIRFKPMNSWQVCLGVGQKLAIVLKRHSRACCIAPTLFLTTRWCWKGILVVLNILFFVSVETWIVVWLHASRIWDRRLSLKSRSTLHSLARSLSLTSTLMLKLYYLFKTKLQDSCLSFYPITGH